MLNFWSIPSIPIHLNLIRPTIISRHLFPGIHFQQQPNCIPRKSPPLIAYLVLARDLDLVLRIRPQRELHIIRLGQEVAHEATAKHLPGDEAFAGADRTRRRCRRTPRYLRRHQRPVPDQFHCSQRPRLSYRIVDLRLRRCALVPALQREEGKGNILFLLLGLSMLSTETITKCTGTTGDNYGQ